jgi:hypothetical protein
MRDTDGNSAFLHCNSNIFYILRGGIDSPNWAAVNNEWPLSINLVNNDVSVGGVLEIKSEIPRIKLTDTTANSPDYFIWVDGNNFPIFVDRNNDGLFDAPHPLVLDLATEKGYLFGREIVVK